MFGGMLNQSPYAITGSAASNVSSAPINQYSVQNSTPGMLSDVDSNLYSQNGNTISYNPATLGASSYQAPRYYMPDGSQAASAQAAQEARDTMDFYNSQADQLQGQIGNLDNQQNVGLGNIGNSFNKGLNRLDEQRGVAQRDYNTGLQNNQRSYLGTRNGEIGRAHV